MIIQRPLSALRNLRDQALSRSIIDYEATRRALAEQERWLQYKDWVDVGDSGAPGFSNGWGNAIIDPAWEPYASEARNKIGFYRDRWGFVHLKGVASNPAHSTAPMFVLPAELVPARANYYGTSYKTAATSGSFAGVVVPFSCLVIVGPNGSVSIGAYNETVYTPVRTVYLDNIVWRAANVGPPA